MGRRSQKHQPKNTARSKDPVTSDCMEQKVQDLTFVGDSERIIKQDAPQTWSGRDWVLALLLLVAVGLAYHPVWQAGFIWDDDMHLTKNPCIIGPLGLKQIWTTAAATYYPLVLTTFWIEHALWGLAP